MDDTTPAATSESQVFAGARHNKVDMAKIQQSHDHMVSLGANCFPPSPEQMATMTNRDMSERVTLHEIHAAFMAGEMQHHALAMPLPQWFTEADEPPEWIPYMPAPQTWKHPKYGDVVLTPERNARFVQHFKEGVYQKPIPIDGEHETKQTGAMAWVYDLRLNDDASIDAQVQWSDRGVKMLAGKRYKFFSPEWYDSWPEPVTGEIFTDVAIGGALTTRPYFKGSYLRPLAASEDSSDQPRAGEGGSMTATTDTVSPAQFSELQQQFAEAQTAREAAEKAFAEEKTAREHAEAEAKVMGERVGKLEAEARTKRFAETVQGWVGDPQANIARLEKLAARFGEESDDFKEEVRERRAFAEQTRMTATTGSIYRELGSPHAGDSDSKGGRLHAMAEERATASNGAKTYQQAYAEVLQAHPELYEG